jgi:hypothetical protein
MKIKIVFLMKNVVFDQLDLVTYEEVVKQENFRRKTLVLLGKVSLSFCILKTTMQLVQIT